MNLSQYPQRTYTFKKTPIEKLRILSSKLNGPDIYIKRDDTLGLTGGGNKTRKLEFVIGDALTNKANALITCGGLQSNHCRLTAAAAVKEQIACHLVLIEEDFQTYNPKAGGNNLLYNLLNVNSINIISSKADPNEEMQKLARNLQKKGAKPYIIPMGASYPVGTLGYMSCTQEIIDQTSEMKVHFDYIICPSGSGGTQTGLIMGINELKYNCRVLGINVSRNKTEQKKIILELIDSSLKYLNSKCKIKSSEIECLDQYVGPGYTVPTDEMIAAVKLLASTEGILLDPVYTGKTMAGLIDLIKTDFFKKEDTILFLHTGGSPALYTCPELFID